ARRLLPATATATATATAGEWRGYREGAGADAAVDAPPAHTDPERAEPGSDPHGTLTGRRSRGCAGPGCATCRSALRSPGCCRRRRTAGAPARHGGRTAPPGRRRPASARHAARHAAPRAVPAP